MWQMDYMVLGLATSLLIWRLKPSNSNRFNQQTRSIGGQ
jgi:hypothetical protein